MTNQTTQIEAALLRYFGGDQETVDYVQRMVGYALITSDLRVENQPTLSGPLQKARQVLAHFHARLLVLSFTNPGIKVLKLSSRAAKLLGSLFYSLQGYACRLAKQFKKQITFSPSHLARLISRFFRGDKQNG